MARWILLNSDVGADRRWCEVDHVTYESVKQKDVHVIGDATIGLPVMKIIPDGQFADLAAYYSSLR